MIQIIQDKYIKISSNSGYVTNWKETDDILNFSSFKAGCFPLSADVSAYYEITNERNQELFDRLAKAIEEQQKAQIKSLQ